MMVDDDGSSKIRRAKLESIENFALPKSLNILHNKYVTSLNDSTFKCKCAALAVFIY